MCCVYKVQKFCHLTDLQAAHLPGVRVQGAFSTSPPKFAFTRMVPGIGFAQVRSWVSLD